MAFNNFTVNIVTFIETAGLDWTISNPSVVLLLTPNLGYNLTASNFSATAPLPSDVSSVVFSQNGNNVNCTVTYISPSVMPANDVLIAVCASGFAEENLISVSGIIKSCGISNVSQPTNLPLAYTGSGIFGSAATVSVTTATASTNYYFEIEPVLALSIGDLSNYTITSAKTYNAANQLTQVIFTVVYNFPQTSVSGDALCLTANAAVIYSPPVCINSYSFPLSSPTILAGGQTNTYTLNGIVGASYNVSLVNSAGTVLLNEVGVLDTSGVKAITLVFPATTVNEIYTLTTTGSCIANGIVTASQQPSVITLNQYIDTQLGFGFSSTNSDITVGAITAKTFIPFQNVPGPQLYTVTATSTSNIVLNTTPTTGDWSGGGGGFYPTDLTYNSYVSLSSYTIDNTGSVKTLKAELTVVIDQAGIPSLNRILNLDNFITPNSTQLALCYATTELALCCGTSTPAVVFVAGLNVANLASVTGLLYTSNTLVTESPDGYYSDDQAISCSGGGGSFYQSFALTTGTNAVGSNMCDVVCNVTLYHSGTGTLPQSGDYIYQTGSQNASPATFTNFKGIRATTGGNSIQAMNVNSLGQVTSIVICNPPQ